MHVTLTCHDLHNAQTLWSFVAASTPMRLRSSTTRSIILSMVRRCMLDRFVGRCRLKASTKPVEADPSPVNQSTGFDGSGRQYMSMITCMVGGGG